MDTAIAAIQSDRKILVEEPAPAGPPASKRQVTLRHLVAAGLLDQDETIISIYGGTRHEATFDERGIITVPGLGEGHTLSDAAKLVVGSPRGGWRIWRVDRDGELVLLDAVRAELWRGRAS